MPDLSATDKQNIMENMQKVADAISDLMPTINPLFEDRTSLLPLRTWIEEFVLLIMTDPIDLSHALELGTDLEKLISFQPDDLLNVQRIVQYTLLRDLSAETILTLYPNLLSAFSAVISGFYVSKARRTAAINMSAVSQMGHDLKTPINAVTGFSHVILREIDGPITEFQKQDLTSIYEAGRKLATMINELFIVMKQDASRIGIYPSPFRVSDVVGEVLANIQPYCAALEHTLSFTLERDLGTLAGDASKVQWILLSLILFLAHQGAEWHISLRATHRPMSDPPVLEFTIDGQAKETLLLQTGEAVQIASVDFINLDVNLAICWRFCTDMGASLAMFEDQGISFQVLIPNEITSSHAT